MALQTLCTGTSSVIANLFYTCYCRFPFAAISIGLVINKEVRRFYHSPCHVISHSIPIGRWQPVVGVVYNFILDHMFAAVKGGGATMNNKPIHVSRCEGDLSIQIMLRLQVNPLW